MITTFKLFNTSIMSHSYHFCVLKLFYLFILLFIELKLVKKMIEFQVYNSKIHHLYTVFELYLSWCVFTTPTQASFRQLYTLLHLLPPTLSQQFLTLKTNKKLTVIIKISYSVSLSHYFLSVALLSLRITPFMKH